MHVRARTHLHTHTYTHKVKRAHVLVHASTRKHTRVCACTPQRGACALCALRCVRACRSWEEERATLLAQIDALHTASALPRGAQPKARASRSTDDWSHADQEEVQELRDELSAAKEKEVCTRGS